MNKTDDSGKFFAEVALAVSIVAVFVVVACYSAIVSSSSWKSFCTAVGNGLSSAWNSLTNGASSLWNWSVKKLKALLSALKDYLTVVQAASKISSKVKRNSRDRYWSASIQKVGKYTYATIGKAISYKTAKTRVKNGQSVFTVTKSEAATIARNFKNPYYEKGTKSCGQYYHYHVYNSNGKKNKAHIWYLF